LLPDFAAAVFLAGNASAVGPGKTLTWAGGSKGAVMFDGNYHAEKGHGCKDCHHGLFSMKFGTAKNHHGRAQAGPVLRRLPQRQTRLQHDDQQKCFVCHKGKKKLQDRKEQEGKKTHTQDE